MDILNSPLIFLIVVLGSIPLLWYLKRRKLKCKQCGKRAMSEMTAIREGIIHEASHQSSGRTAVRTKVKYQCENCGEFFETLEYRQ
jgi:uncharacterized Zn finger protein